jgi:hypothetical protein
MHAQPAGKGVFRHITRGDGQHGEYTVGIISHQLVAIDPQKKLGSDKTRALVAIDKRVIAKIPIAIGSPALSSPHTPNASEPRRPGRLG